MATRAERARAEAQRKHRQQKTKERARGADSRRKVRTGKKATYALEAPRKGRPSRKSTRKAANRSKPDTGFNLTEAKRKGSPEARARRARAQGLRPRGGGR